MCQRLCLIFRLRFFFIFISSAVYCSIVYMTIWFCLYGIALHYGNVLLNRHWIPQNQYNAWNSIRTNAHGDHISVLPMRVSFKMTQWSELKGKTNRKEARNICSICRINLIFTAPLVTIHFFLSFCLSLYFSSFSAVLWPDSIRKNITESERTVSACVVYAVCVYVRVNFDIILSKNNDVFFSFLFSSSSWW